MTNSMKHRLEELLNVNVDVVHAIALEIPAHRLDNTAEIGDIFIPLHCYYQVRTGVEQGPILNGGQCLQIYAWRPQSR